MNANGSHRTAEERESHGVPYKGLSSQATTNPIHGNSVEREAPVHVSQTWGAYGSYKAHIPQSFKCFQEEPKLGQKNFYESVIWKDEEYINKIKSPLLNTNAVPKDPEPDTLCQKVADYAKTNHRRRWTSWLW
jgi:hypothetical protein